MSVSLNFGNYNHYYLNKSRIASMVQADEKKATHIGLWDRFKDFFRTNKKSDACRELYNLLYYTDGGDRLDAFNKLKSFANPEHQALFTKEIYCDDVVFYIGDEKIGQSGLQSLMSLSEHTPLCPMSMPEQSLFLDMLDTIREKTRLFGEYRASHIRKLMSDEHGYDLLELYRPQEDINDPGTQWNDPQNIDYKEKNLLRYLNRGSMKPLSEFSFMGYQRAGGGVEFSMLHPSINYLLTSYIRTDEESSLTMDLNVGYIKRLNETYQNYYDKKYEIDSVLNKIYHAHGETLNIAYHTINNNKLVSSPDMALDYVFQSDDFSGDISVSINSIFRKWTEPGETSL